MFQNALQLKAPQFGQKEKRLSLKAAFTYMYIQLFSYPAVTEICICSCKSSRIVSTSLLGQTKRCSPLFVHLQTRDKADNPSIHCIVRSLLMCKKKPHTHRQVKLHGFPRYFCFNECSPTKLSNVQKTLLSFAGSCADVSDQCALLKDVFCAPDNVDGQNVCPQTCGVCRENPLINNSIKQKIKMGS